MEKTLSNELFIVGVSLDCLRAGVPVDSFLDNRLSALSGQVLSDSKKMEEMESKADTLDFCRKAFREYFCDPDIADENKSDVRETLELCFGAKSIHHLID